MKKYLELFREGFDSTVEEKRKIENWPYIGYDVINDSVAWSTIVEKEEPDPVAGYVDLGLSVMWASCNLGASNPEELGETYRWGETDEHKSGEVEYTEYPNLVEHSYSYDRDAVTVSMKDNPYVKYLHYRIPTAELWQELIDNTTREVYTNSEGRNICKYTSNINGNFILLPLLMEVEGNKEIYYKTTTPTEGQNSWYGEVIRIYSVSGTNSIVYDGNDAMDYQSNYVRGVCSYPPKTDIIQYGDSISSDSTFVLTSAHSIEITCPENFTVYFSTTPNFTPDSTDENVVGYYKAITREDNYYRQISCQELSFGQSEHDYLYMRFVCDKTTTLTPSIWDASYYLKQTILINLGEPVSIPASDNNVYRVVYDDIANYDWTITWDNKYGNLVIYVASYCNFKTTATDLLGNIGVRKNSSTTINATEVDSWAKSIEDEGFIYIRFGTSRKGNVAFTSAKPAE